MLFRSFKVSFVVQNEDGQAVTDAIITIDGVTYAAGQWQVDGIIPGNHAYTIARPGYSTITGNFSIDTENIVINVLLLPVSAGADLAEPLAILLHPNPAHSALQISASQPIEEIRIIDLRGRTLILDKPDLGTAIITISDLPTGIYLARIVSGHTITTRRFVKMAGGGY